MDDLLYSWAPFANEEYLDTEPYKYTSISLQDEIRCLILEPGQGEDPLLGSIKTYSLAERPEYEAISYAWGVPRFRSKITCDDHRMLITRTLWDSLRQCRLPNQQRVLWADAICINQADKHEKSHQVRLMADIYSQATQVLICLGPDNDGHAEQAFSFVHDANRMIEDQLRTCHGWGSFPTFPTTYPLFHDTRLESFAALTYKPWFYRGWVIQEATLALNVQILYGQLNCNWLHFLRTETWFSKRAQCIQLKYAPNNLVIHRNNYRSRFRSEGMNFYSKGSFRLLSLPELLDSARPLKFTDPRDRIYAFMGLPMAKDYRDNLEISYEATVLETYRSFASFYVDQTRDLRLLHFADHNAETLSSTCPSWVPQWWTNDYHHTIVAPWHVPILPERMPTLTPLVERNQGGLEYLKLKGIAMDVVVFASDCLHKDSSIADVALVWAKLQEYEHRYGPSVYTSFLPVWAFLGAISCDMNLGSDNDMEESAVASIYIQHLEGQLPTNHSAKDLTTSTNSTGLKEDESLAVAHDWLTYCVDNRKVAMTQRGYYCLVPGVAEEGDICCILYGTMSPFVLRKSAVQGSYQLLGDTFMVSSYDFRSSGHYFPLRIGAGLDTHADWLDLGLEEQDIVII